MADVYLLEEDMSEVIEVNFETGGDSYFGVGRNATQNWTAVKFTIGAEILCSSASIYFDGVNGSPTGDLTFRIETDDGGEPSGDLAHANATGTIANGDITQPAWNKCSFTPLTLSADTYWLVCYIPDQGTENNNWKWVRDNSQAGGVGSSTDHGANWTIYNDDYYTYYRIYRSTTLFIDVHDCTDLVDKVIGG